MTLLFPTHYLGNLVLGLPWVLQLLQQTPQNRVVIDSSFETLLSRLPMDPDQLLFYPRRELAKTRPPLQRLMSYLGFLRNLRQLEPDTLVDMEGERFTGVLSRFSGCRQRLGPMGKRAGIFYSECHRLDYQRHRFNAFGQILETFSGGRVPSPQLPFTTDPGSDARIDQLLAGIQTQALVIIHCGASVSYKYWPAEHFVSLAGKLMANNCLPVWIGAGAADQRRVDAIRAELGEDAGIDLCGKLSLVELLSLMQRAHCFLGSDSGPMHLAASINLPLVALFGPSRSAIWAPLGANSLCLRGSETCAEDCDAHHCRFNYRCLRSLTPHAVFESLPVRQAMTSITEE